MAFNDIERKRVENEAAAFVEKVRPPAHVRPKLDIGYRVENQNVLIFEIRPSFRDPSSKHEGYVAKATYVRTDKCLESLLDAPRSEMASLPAEARSNFVGSVF